MQSTDIAIKRALVTGTITGIATALATSLAGKRETGSYAAPLNATSHIVWGKEAAMQDRASLKYTLTGFLLNQAATVFWAAFYEKFFGAQSVAPHWRNSYLRPVLGGAAVAAGAYVNDYYLMPKRLTPGFEMRLSGPALLSFFGVMALGLAARDLMTQRSSGAPHNPLEGLKTRGD